MRKLEHVLVLVMLFYSCGNEIKSKKDYSEDQRLLKDSIVKLKDSIELLNKDTSFCYQFKLNKLLYSLPPKSWFLTEYSKENWFLPLPNLIEENNKDTLRNLMLDYRLGVTFFYTNNFGIPIKIPLFVEELKGYSFNTFDMYDYYSVKYQTHIMFAMRHDYTLKNSFKLIDKETKTYEVTHEEFYQPNFETIPVKTGKRIFTFSLKKGTIKYKLEGKIVKKWY